MAAGGIVRYAIDRAVVIGLAFKISRVGQSGEALLREADALFFGQVFKTALVGLQGIRRGGFGLQAALVRHFRQLAEQFNRAKFNQVVDTLMHALAAVVGDIEITADGFPARLNPRR